MIYPSEVVVKINGRINLDDHLISRLFSAIPKLKDEVIVELMRPKIILLWIINSNLEMKRKLKQRCKNHTHFLNPRNSLILYANFKFLRGFGKGFHASYADILYALFCLFHWSILQPQLNEIYSLLVVQQLVK